MIRWVIGIGAVLLSSLSFGQGWDTLSIEQLNDLAYDYTLRSLDTARQLIDLVIEKNEGDTVQQGVSLETLAVIEEISGNIDESARLHFAALELFELTGSRINEAWVWNNMGALYYQQYDYDLALDYFLKALTIRKELGKELEVAKSEINIALIFNQRSTYDSSFYYLRSALGKIDPIEESFMYGYVLINLGSTYAYAEKFDSAEYFIRKSIVAQATNNDIEGLEVAYRKLGEIFIEKEDYSAAIECFDTSIKYIEQYGDLGRYAEVRQSQAQTYYKVKQYKKAFDLLADYLELKDSLINMENKQVVNEYAAKYESAKKEQAIIQLELEKKDAVLALTQSKNLRNLFVLGTISLFLLAIFLQYRYRSKKKTSDLLSQKNDQISAALEERELLLREIHHRVKNNLQVISSLLKLQAETLSDSSAKDAVMEGENRVKSMSLIHQRLYSTDDVRGVELQDYFERLFDELFSAFGIEEEKVANEIATSNIKLDIDTVIPLGLIVNELITNALKYAFDGESGIINLSVAEIDSHLIVSLSDNGKGMPAEAVEKSNSFGWKMIHSLARKLKATIDIDGDHGTTVQLSIARYKLVV